MRDLHVVTVSDDGRHVVLATSADARKGTFRVALDARLRSAVQGRPPPRSAPSAEQPALSVRDIQARLRAGESAEDIATSAGVALERVERFAGPVRSEQEKIVESARATPLLHSRRGLSALPLGEAVDVHFAQIDSLRPESVGWTARREDGGTWIVEVSYVARARTRSGSWRYDPAAGTLTAADTVSATLGHSETADGAAPAAAAPRRRAPSAAKTPSAKGASDKAPAKRAAVPATVSAKATPSAAVAAPPARRRPQRAVPPRAPAAVRTTPGTKAPPVVAPPRAKKAAPASRGPAAQPSAGKAPAARGTAAVPKPPTSAKPAADVPAGPPTLRVVPALDQQPRQPPASRAGGGRASVPAWADVLLSTSPPAAEKQADPGEASSD